MQDDSSRGATNYQKQIESVDLTKQIEVSEGILDSAYSILGIVFGVVAALLIGGGVYYYYYIRSKRPTQPEITIETE